jgi:peptidoglycan-associated lipoprotein
MKKLAAVLALAVLIAAPGCKKNPPQPIPLPPPPVAPATPPPAPAPEPEIAPVLSDYDRMKVMDSAALEQLGLLGDINFDYDSADIREGDKATLARNAETLKKYDFMKITIEGHADERGTVEYNLALGERRSRNASDYLAQLGVPPDRMKTVSYGKEVPICTQSSEDCWSRNRRSHFAVTGKVGGTN